MSRLINQQEFSPLFGVFFKEKWLLKIKSSVVAENYSCYFLNCMISKTIVYINVVKLLTKLLSFVN